MKADPSHDGRAPQIDVQRTTRRAAVATMSIREQANRRTVSGEDEKHSCPINPQILPEGNAEATAGPYSIVFHQRAMQARAPFAKDDQETGIPA